MSLLVTGADGFIGSALGHKILEDNIKVKGVVQTLTNVSRLPKGIEIVEINDISQQADWTQALTGVDAVIHLAARVHIIKESAADPLEAFRKTNVLGTEHFARMAAKAGVKRFLFMSSIGVHGEANLGKPFTEKDVPCPVSAYAISKWEAEQALRKVAENSKMEVIILRSPLVYGPGAPGHFARLVRLVKKGVPLPLGHIKNLRSFTYLGNLIDAIMTCMRHPKAAGENFLVNDGQDVSTSDLIQMMAIAMNKKEIGRAHV